MPGQHDDVLVIVDAATLLAAHPDASLDADAPTPIGGQHVYVMNAGDAQQIGRNDSRIVVKLSAGDELHLRESALSLRAEESVVFYRFALADGSVMSSLEVVADHATLSVPNPQDLLQPKTQKTGGHFWRGEVLTAGSTTCEADFVVLGSDEKIKGYFRWKISIDIES
ncbi:AidA/PixA family protein [Paraburkholderia sp. BL21I4N1]|uniref:AidA/PixA family protein n=1 Tax=Paraburkholderia sp. BL21I4N1 TaxID=1938801 RepID=UPI000CFC0FDA|nr:AidA/PixA family protein [Paraburkholderia sp. BL21I4N1]PQV54060.1 inclusion body protein [Paraburkholderia sp. BL21I4N1]